PACKIIVSGDAGNDTLNMLVNAPAGVEFRGGTQADTTHQLNIMAGNYVISSDENLTTRLLSINVGPGASVTFTSSQHLTSLELNGGSASVTGAGNPVLRTSALGISGNGNLDLGFNTL